MREEQSIRQVVVSSNKILRENQVLVKSKERVQKHGEVFTPDFIVKDMLNLVLQETERIDSRFLDLVQIETLKVNKDIGIEYAKALAKADVKILANSGDVQSGMSSIKDIVSSKGGAGLVGLLEGLKQSETGSEFVDGLLDKLKG